VSGDIASRDKIGDKWTPRKTSPFGEEFDSVGALICGE